MNNNTQDKVHVERFLELPINKAWDIMTKPEHVTNWWGKGTWHDEVGKEYQLFFDMGELTGKVLEVQPPHTFRFSFRHEGIPEQTVTFSLKEQDGGTLWVIDHIGFDKMMGEQRSKVMGDVNHGWTHFSDKMVALSKEIYAAGATK